MVAIFVSHRKISAWEWSRAPFHVSYEIWREFCSRSRGEGSASKDAGSWDPWHSPRGSQPLSESRARAGVASVVTLLVLLPRAVGDLVL